MKIEIGAHAYRQKPLLCALSMYRTRANMQPNSRTEHHGQKLSPTDAPHEVLTLQFVTILGVNDIERVEPQPITVLVVGLPASNQLIRKRGEKLIGDFISNNKPQLLEHLVYRLALDLLEHFPKLVHVRVTAQKPAAIREAQYAFATIAMTRREHIEPRSDQ